MLPLLFQEQKERLRKRKAFVFILFNNLVSCRKVRALILSLIQFSLFPFSLFNSIVYVKIESKKNATGVQSLDNGFDLYKTVYSHIKNNNQNFRINPKMKLAAILISILSITRAAPVPRELENNKVQRLLSGPFESARGLSNAAINGAENIVVHPLKTVGGAAKQTGVFLRHPLKTTGTSLKNTGNEIKRQWKEDPLKATTKLATDFGIGAVIGRYMAPHVEKLIPFKPLATTAEVALTV
jgi:hypothetical protein